MCIRDRCLSGTFVCNAAGTNTECEETQHFSEMCNGQDDDCDGLVDEGNPGGGAGCSTGGQGICAAGVMICQSGGVTCVANNQPATEVCNGLDDDCDGATDSDAAWPSPDSHEPNQGPLGNPSSSAEIFENSSPFTAFGPNNTSFSSPADFDAFYWDDLSNQQPPNFALCRVTGMASGATVDVQLGYRRSGDPPLPYLYGTQSCNAVGNGGTCTLPIGNPTAGPDQYAFAVWVVPDSGITPCTADYDLECKLSNNPTW